MARISSMLAIINANIYVLFSQVYFLSEQCTMVINLFCQNGGSKMKKALLGMYRTIQKSTLRKIPPKGDC